MVEGILSSVHLTRSELTSTPIQGTIAYTYSILDGYSLVYTDCCTYRDSKSVYTHFSVKMSPGGKLIFYIKERGPVIDFVHTISSDDFVLSYHEDCIVLTKQSFSEYLTDWIYNCSF